MLPADMQRFLATSCLQALSFLVRQELRSRIGLAFHAPCPHVHDSGSENRDEVGTRWAAKCRQA